MQNNSEYGLFLRLKCAAELYKLYFQVDHQQSTRVILPLRYTHVEITGHFSSIAYQLTLCLHKMLLTFLMTATSDSSFLKFSLRFFIFSEFIIPLVCSVEFKNSSVSWVLYNVLCVFSVYSSHIVEEYYNDTKWLNKNFTFFSHRSC